MFHTSLPMTQVWSPIGVRKGAVPLLPWPLPLPGAALATLASSEAVRETAKFLMVIVTPVGLWNQTARLCSHGAVRAWQKEDMGVLRIPFIYAIAGFSRTFTGLSHER